MRDFIVVLLLVLSCGCASGQYFIEEATSLEAKEVVVNQQQQQVQQRHNWTPPSALCVVPNVGNGSVVDMDADAVASYYVGAGALVRAVCDPGYLVQEGTITAQCLDDGTWSDNLGVCTRAFVFFAPTVRPTPPTPSVFFAAAVKIARRSKAPPQQFAKTTETPTEALFLDDINDARSGSVGKYDDCGRSGTDAGTIAYKIFGGKQAKKNAYPWMARLQFWLAPNTAHYCGATLLSSRWLLTTASCMFARPIIRSRVLLSSYDRSQIGSNEGEKVFSYVQVVAHPKYNRDRPFENNYALIQLNQTVEFSESIRPICLPDDANICDNDAYPTNATTIDGCNQVIAAGWGLSTIGWEWGYPNELRHVAMNYMSFDDCKAIAGELHSYEVCAGGSDGRDTCIGDSGGPLMCYSNERFVLVGITSSGTSPICGTDGRPGIYSRVCNAVKWIRRVISS